MKRLLLLPLILFFACDNQPRPSEDISQRRDSISIRPEIPLVHPLDPDTVLADTTVQPDTVRTYGNTKFKDVTITQISEEQFRVSGKAQVSNAAFRWVLEDGHHELRQGAEKTDAAAPEFGSFDFKFTAQKRDSNSTLHLILFESSTRKGTRLHELPIPLF